MLELNGTIINRYKLVHCFLKKEGIDFSESDKYFYMPNLEDLIQSKYDVKVLDWKHLQKAKKVGHELSEHEIQVKVCQYMKENKICHFAIPNGFVTDLGYEYINYMKAEGYKPGAPDLMILPGNGKTVFMELKTEKGVLSEFQIRWQKWLLNNGYIYKLAFGYDDAINFIKKLV